MKQTAFLSIWMAVVGVLCLPHARALPYSSLLDEQPFSPARTSRHISLLGGLAEEVDSAMFDSVVEFFFTNFGEEAGMKGRSYESGTDFKHTPSYEGNHFEGIHTGSGYSNFMTGYKHEGQTKPEKTCIDVYGLSHSSSFCLDVFAALSVAGVALLLQILFFIAVEVFCPDLKRNDDSIDGALNGLNTLLGLLGAGNMSSLFAIDNSNSVTVDAVGGDMMKTGDGEGSVFLNKDNGKFAGCEALVFVGEDQTTTTTASPESSGTEEEKDTEEEDNERFLRKEGREGDDDDDDEKDEEDDSEKDDEDRERTSSTTTTTTTTPKPSRGPLLVLVKKSGGICYVTSATEYMGGHYEQDPTLTEQWRSIEHLFSPSLLLQAKNWFMDEARLFGYKFGGKNSPLCRVLSYFV